MLEGSKTLPDDGINTVRLRSCSNQTPVRRRLILKIPSTSPCPSMSNSYRSAPVTLYCTTLQLRVATSYKACLYSSLLPLRSQTLVRSTVPHSYVPHARTPSNPSDQLFYPFSFSHRLCGSITDSFVYPSLLSHTFSVNSSLQ